MVQVGHFFTFLLFLLSEKNKTKNEKKDGVLYLHFFNLLIFYDFMRIYHIQYNDAFGFAVCAIPADYSQQFVFLFVPTFFLYFPSTIIQYTHVQTRHHIYFYSSTYQKE